MNELKRALQRRFAAVAALVLGGLLGALPGTAAAQPSMLDPTLSQISAGGNHTCALTAAGGVKCWGRNGFGQSGDGTTTSPRSTPVDVSGLSSGVVSISAGSNHTCALTTSGGLKCWGWNLNGQLGDGTNTNRSTPVSVSGLSSGVAAVSSGYAQTCALLTSGTVKCWGYNGSGQLGDGTTTDRNVPTDVSGLSSVAGVWVGGAHACVLTSTGGVKCWGENGVGQVGDGTIVNRSIPVNVSGLLGGVATLATGDGHTCAVTTSGGLKCWGDNSAGTLGDGTTTQRRTPVDVSGLTSAVASVAAGERDTCALTTAGAVKCWGYNFYGQVGDGTTTNRTTAVNTPGLTSGVAALSANWHHVCALTTTGGAKCWGRNTDGQIGDGTTTNRTAPANVPGLAAGTTLLAVGGHHACVIGTGGVLKCWGYNGAGQVGDGTTTNRLTPVSVLGFAGGAAGVSSGPQHTCALTATGGVKCWGLNSSGELGDGTTVQRITPVDVSGLSTGVAAISAGYYHTCALTTAGGVKCWGGNATGQVGDGTQTQRNIPTDVSGLTSGVQAISTRGFHTCALAGGAVKCWGRNAEGQLGDGATGIQLVPTPVTGLGSGVASIAAGGNHTCAILASGLVKCWGLNAAGQLGDGSQTSRTTPVDVSGVSASQLAARYNHTCAVTTAGGVKCWGDNTYGALGDGTTTTRLSPVDVAGPTTGAASVSLGDNHSCALTTAGTLRCWGRNSVGQLGDGTTTQRLTPVAVLAGQSIAFTPPALLTVGATTTLTATATSGLPVTFDTWTPAKCVVTGTKVTAVASGLCGIRASQTGSGNNAAAPQRSSLINVVSANSGLWINDVTTAEGNSGTKSLFFTVTLSPANTNTVTVSYATLDGSASAGSDYTSTSGTLSFAPGDTTKTITVPVTGDTVAESNEAFGVILSGSSYSTIGRQIGLGTILNDDASSATTRAQPSWQEFFAVDTLETPYIGDFDGDGKTDIITFTRQNPNAIGDVYVALSDGVKFGANTKWHDFFAISTDEAVIIGDYNGDGKDDIATWLAKTSRQAYVALSTGSGMTTESVWVDSIGTDPSDLLFAGDTNGDGKDDLVAFARKQGKVYVALSDGTKFGAPTVWHGFFAVSTFERPRVADVNGDGKADIVTFATDSPTAFGDVYVATSDGTKFVGPTGAADDSSKWHDFFAIRPTEEIRIGDLNGDGQDDFFTFLPPPFAQCYSVLSQGTSMAENALWAEAVAPLLGAGDNVYVGDVNGDGKDDIIIFAQKEGKVFVSLAP